MIENNVIPMMNVLAERIRKGHEREQRGRLEWIEGVLEVAAAMLEARDRFASNVQFGVWIAENSLNFYNDDDRNALVNMGRYPEATRIVLQETGRHSLQHIWREEIAPRLVELRSRHVTRTEPTSTFEPKQQQIAPPEPEKAETPEPETPKSTVTLTPEKPRAILPKTGPKSSLQKLPNADLVYAHIRSKETRHRLNEMMRSKKMRGFWDLLIESIETGIFGEPCNISITDPLRILVPSMSQRSLPRLDLHDAKTYPIVREFLFPLLRDSPDLKTAPHLLEKELENRRRAHEEQARQQAKLAQHKQQAVPENQQRIVAYGEPLWPPMGDLSPRFTYQELCHACWYASYFMGIARKDWRPLETAMAARHLTKYLQPLQPGFVTAIRAIFNAYEANPTGETMFPMTPVNFGY